MSYENNENAADIMDEQQLDQLSQSMYSYCHVMRVPRLGVALILITILEGVIITLITAAMGISIGRAVAIGAIFTGIFALICWAVIRLRKGSSKRLNSYLAADGGRSMYTDFASAQPLANDQFRLGRNYLFIKNSAVLRRDSITDLIRTNGHYRSITTSVFLSVAVEDESGSMSFPLCRVHTLKAAAEIDEIREAVLGRQSQPAILWFTKGE